MQSVNWTSKAIIKFTSFLSSYYDTENSLNRTLALGADSYTDFRCMECYDSHCTDTISTSRGYHHINIMNPDECNVCNPDAHGD